MTEETRGLWGVLRDSRKDLVEDQRDWGMAIVANEAFFADTHARFGRHALHGVAVDACQHAVRCVWGHNVEFWGVLLKVRLLFSAHTSVRQEHFERTWLWNAAHSNMKLMFIQIRQSCVKSACNNVSVASEVPKHGVFI